MAQLLGGCDACGGRRRSLAARAAIRDERAQRCAGRARAAALSTCRSYTLPSAGARTCVDAARRPRIRTRAGASRSMAPATHMNKYRTDRYVED